jgi:guanylate kinase
MNGPLHQNQLGTNTNAAALHHPCMTSLLETESLGSRSCDIYYGCETWRKQHLESLIHNDNQGIIVITGLSGSGKDFFLSLLSERETATPVQRRSTREPRPNEPESHHTVMQEAFDQNGFVLAYRKGGNMYGYHMQDILYAISNGSPAAVIIGDPGKVQPFVAGLSKTLPLTPHTIVHLSVDPKEITRRLQNRPASDPAESERRVEQNTRFRFVEREALFHIRSQHNALVLGRVDVSEKVPTAMVLGKSMTLSDAIELIVGELKGSQARSAEVGRDLYYPKEIPSDMWSVPSVVSEGLTVIARATKNISSPLLLKGGTAAVAYLVAQHQQENSSEPRTTSSKKTILQTTPAPEVSARAARMISADIDFMIAENENHESIVKEVIECIDTLSSNSDATVQLKTYYDKPIFKSTKASIEVTLTDLSLVSLDFIETSRVQPTGSPWTFSYKPSQHDNFMRRPLQVGDNTHICLLPPEALALEKFIAARGPELGKFDLWDAAAVICSQTVRTSSILEFLSQQTHDSQFDRAPSLYSKDEILGNPDLLAEFGIHDARTKHLIVNRIDGKGTGIEDIGLCWSLDTIKQFALIESLSDGIEASIACRDLVFNLGADHQGSLGQIFGRDFVKEKLSALRELLFHLGGMHIGRTDLYEPKIHSEI